MAELRLGGESRAALKELGPVAWAALESLALLAEPTGDDLVAPVGVRQLAGAMGANKDTAARALGTLAEAGLVARIRVDGDARRSAYRINLPPGLELACGTPEDALTCSTDGDSRIRPTNADARTCPVAPDKATGPVHQDRRHGRPPARIRPRGPDTDGTPVEEGSAVVRPLAGDIAGAVAPPALDDAQQHVDRAGAEATPATGSRATGEHRGGLAAGERTPHAGADETGLSRRTRRSSVPERREPSSRTAEAQVAAQASLFDAAPLPTEEREKR